jgi:ABC-type Fe3+-siderophore transport system permease subunit
MKKSRSLKKHNNFLFGAILFFVIYVGIQFIFSSFDVIDVVAAFIGALVFYFTMIYISRRK